MKFSNMISKSRTYSPKNDFVTVISLTYVIVIFSITFSSCTTRFNDDLKVLKKDQNQIKHAEIIPHNSNINIQPILGPQYISDVSDHFYVDNDPIPANTPYMIVRWQTDDSKPGNAISKHVTYDPGSYTGYTPPSPRSEWQRGQFDDPVSVSPVYQLHGYHGGIMMNSWFIPWTQIIGGGENTGYGYNFSQPFPKPWNKSSSKLWVQASLKLPWFANWDINQNGNAPVGQLGFLIYLHDVKHHIAIAVAINIFDNRPDPVSHHVGWDTHTYFVGAILGDTRYLTPNPYSQSWRHHTWNDDEFFRAEITRQNLINIVTDINNKKGTNLSTDLNDYVLTMAGIMQETVREEGDQISMGSSFYGFGVFEAY